MNASPLVEGPAVPLAGRLFIRDASILANRIFNQGAHIMNKKHI
jgi:hypothetical protein